MTDVINFTKQAFTWSVVAMTIVWSLGLAALAPVAASAATCPTIDAGELVKFGTAPAVYVVDEDMALHTFTNPEQLGSWGLSTADVTTVAATCINNYNNPSSMAGRGFSYGLMKPEIGATVYLLALDGAMYSIPTAEVAEQLWGANWGSAMRGIAPFLASNYRINTATELSLSNLPNEIIVSYGGKMWVHRNGTVFPIEGTLNSFVAARAIIGTDAMVAGLTVSDTTVSAASLFNVLRDFDMVSTPTTPGTETPVTGTITASLSASTPASTSVPAGATRVEVAKFTLNGTGTVNSLKFRRVGVGAPAEIANVYLYEGNNRLTTSRSLNSSSQEVTFAGLNMQLSGSRTVSVVVDFAGDVPDLGYGAHAFELTSAAAVGATANVAGSFPLRGNEMYRADVAAGSVEVNRVGSTVDPKIGETGAKLAEFTVRAGSVEAIDLRSITLFQSGNISSSNISNFRLFQGGSEVAMGSWIGNDRIVFVLTNPMMLDKGQQRTFEVRADIGTGARIGDSISLYVEDDADIHATGQIYGFGVSVDNDFDATSSANSEVEGGDITISFLGPARTDVAPDTQNVELFRFSFAAQNNLDVRRTRLEFNSTESLGTNGSKYRNIRVINTATNQVLVGPFDLDDTGPAGEEVVVRQESWTVDAGSSLTLAVVADIANFAPESGETIQVSLVPFTTNDIRNLDNNLFISSSDIVPSSAVVGNAHPVIDSTLTVTQAGTPAATTVINGTSNVVVTGLNFKASDAKDLSIRSLTITAVGASSCTTETACVLSVRLFDGDTQVGSARSLSGDKATFNNLNVMVGRGQTKTLTVRADLNRLSSIGGGTTLRLGLADSGDVIAQDSNGNTVTATVTSANGPVHQISNGGTMTVSQAPLTAQNERRLVQAGSQGETLGEFRFAATDEALRLSRVTVVVPTTSTQEVGGVALFDGATQLTNYTPVSGDGTVVFGEQSFLTPFAVNPNSQRTLTVRGNLNPVSETASNPGQGSLSGTEITVQLTAMEARGVNASSNSVVAISNSAVSRAVYMVRSVLTATEGTLTSQESTLQNTTNRTVYRFALSSTGGETIAVNQMTFDIDVVGDGELDNFQLFRGNTLIDSAVFSTSTVDDSISTLVVSSTDGGFEFSGTEQFRLVARLSGFDVASGSGDSVSVRLASDDSFGFARGDVATHVGAGHSFIWSDLTFGTVSTSNTAWFNAAFVRNFNSFTGSFIARNN
jgi:hypothetical protein